MRLRKVTYEDWKLLLDWRNDTVTRENSFKEEEISEERHKEWLTESLSNPSREIYILEDRNISVGSIRVDHIGNSQYTLSWNIAPSSRQKGYGTTMLKLLLENKKGDFIAEIKPENVASIKVVQKNGFTQVSSIKYIKKQ